MIAGLPGRRKSPGPQLRGGCRPVLASPAMPPAAPPPAIDPLVALADRCVQCGLCLPACPTYGLDRLEAESPRGRIALARAWALDTIEPTPAGDAHLDHCLACRSCEAVCPAGVKYGELLVGARAASGNAAAPAWRQRLIEALSAPAALAGRARCAAYRWALPLAAAALAAPAAPAAPRPADPRARRQPPAANASRLFVGCVGGALRSRPAQRACAAVRGAGRRGRSNRPARPAAAACTRTPATAVAARRLAAPQPPGAWRDADTVLTLASGCHESVAIAWPARRDARRASRFLDDARRRVALASNAASASPCTCPAPSATW